MTWPITNSSGLDLNSGPRSIIFRLVINAHTVVSCPSLQLINISLHYASSRSREQCFCQRIVSSTNLWTRHWRTRRLYCVEWHNTVFARSGPISVYKRFTSHSTMPNVTCLRVSDFSVFCRVTYFQFPIHSDFLPYIGRQAVSLRRAIGIRNIGHRSDRSLPKIWVGAFPVRSVHPRGTEEKLWFDSSLTVKNWN